MPVPATFGVVGERKDDGFPLKTAGMTGGGGGNDSGEGLQSPERRVRGQAPERSRRGGRPPERSGRGRPPRGAVESRRGDGLESFTTSVER